MTSPDPQGLSGRDEDHLERLLLTGGEVEGAYTPLGLELVGGGSDRAGILSAVAAAVLVHQGLTEFGVAFATAVLPAVFDIERIELSPGDRRLVTEIRLRYAYRQGFATEDELYAALPGATREVINRYDFADFIGRLRAAGLIDESGGHRLRLREPDDPRPGLGLR